MLAAARCVFQMGHRDEQRSSAGNIAETRFRGQKHHQRAIVIARGHCAEKCSATKQRRSRRGRSRLSAAAYSFLCGEIISAQLKEAWALLGKQKKASSQSQQRLHSYCNCPAPASEIRCHNKQIPSTWLKQFFFSAFGELFFWSLVSGQRTTLLGR